MPFILLSLIKTRVISVEVLVVEVILNDTECIAEALEVDDLALAQEADRVGDVVIVAEAQDIVVGFSRLLLCCEVLRQVGDRVAGRLEGVCVPRHAACRDGIESGGMVDEIGVEAACLDLLGREVAGELIHDRADHLHMRELLGTDVGEDADRLVIGHTVALGKVAHRRAELAVGAAELGDYELCKRGVRVFDINGVLQLFLIAPHLSILLPMPRPSGFDPIPITAARRFGGKRAVKSLVLSDGIAHHFDALFMLFERLLIFGVAIEIKRALVCGKGVHLNLVHKAFALVIHHFAPLFPP